MHAIARPAPAIYLDTSHVEEGLRLFTAVTISPFKNIVFHLIPTLGAMMTGGILLRSNDPTQESMMSSHVKQRIIEEIRVLSQAAGVSPEPNLYTALSSLFSTYGGTLSLERPILCIPYQYLFRQGRNPFTQETSQDALANDPWNFTDDETRFLISRQLAQLKGDNLLRIAIKIALFTILYFVYINPLSMAMGITAGLLALAIYLACEITFEANSNREGFEILARRFDNRERAQRAALSALEKLKRQNILRRECNLLCRIYINEIGTNYLDLAHPSPQSSIDQIENLQ